MLSTPENEMLRTCVKLSGKQLAEAVEQWLKTWGHIAEGMNLVGLSLHEDVDSDAVCSIPLDDPTDPTGIVAEFERPK